MAIPIQVNSNWSDGGVPIYGSVSLNAANIYELDETVAVGAGGTKHDFGVPSPANMIAIILLITGNTLGVSTYDFTTWAELMGSQTTQLDHFSAIVDGVPLIWVLGNGTNPLQVATAPRSTKVINTTPNLNTARVQLRVACS